MRTNPYRVEEIPQTRHNEASPRRWPQLVIVAIVSAVLAAVTTWYVLTRHGHPPPASSSVTAVQVEPAPGRDQPHHPQLIQQGD